MSTYLEYDANFIITRQELRSEARRGEIRQDRSKSVTGNSKHTPATVNCFRQLQLLTIVRNTAISSFHSLTHSLTSAHKRTHTHSRFSTPLPQQQILSRPHIFHSSTHVLCCSLKRKVMHMKCKDQKGSCGSFQKISNVKITLLGSNTGLKPSTSLTPSSKPLSVVPSYNISRPHFIPNRVMNP